MTDARQPPPIYIAMLPRRRRRAESRRVLLVLVSVALFATIAVWWLTQLKP